MNECPTYRNYVQMIVTNDGENWIARRPTSIIYRFKVMKEPDGSKHVARIALRDTKKLRDEEKKARLKKEAELEGMELQDYLDSLSEAEDRCDAPGDVSEESEESSPEIDLWKAKMEEFIVDSFTKKMTAEGRISYVQERFLNELDISLIPGDEIIEREYKRITHNRAGRVKRYRRKVYANKWNWFITLTYDDKKWSDPDDFEKAVRKTMSNFHSRHGWNYIGVWEKGEKNHRKHFHCIAHIEEGKMVGELFVDHHWSEKKHAQEYFTNNTYFQERFGVARFDRIDGAEGGKGRIMKYLLKYITKTNERLVYSRGVPAELLITMDMDTKKDFIAMYEDGYNYTRFVIRQDFFKRNEDSDDACAEDMLLISKEEHEKYFMRAKAA